MDLQQIIHLVKGTKGIITNREMAAHVKEKAVGTAKRELAKENFSRFLKVSEQMEMSTKNSSIYYYKKSISWQAILNL